MSLQEFYKYARDYMEPKNESARRRFWELVDFFESLSLPKGGRILDLCAGTGIVGAALAKATNAEVLTVLDARAEDLARVNAWLEFGNIGLDVTVVRGDVREIPKLVGEHDIATLFGNSMVHFDPFDAVRIFSGVASVLSGGGVFIIEDRDRVQQLLQSKGGRELFLIRSEENHALASIQEGYEVRRGTLRVSYYLIPGFKKVGSFDYHHWDLATQLAIGGIFFQESRLLTRGEHGRGIGDVLLFKNPRKGIADRIFEDYNV